MTQQKNPHRRNTGPWRRWEAANTIEPLSDAALSDLEESAVWGIGHEYGEATFDDELSRQVLGLLRRLRDTELGLSHPRCPQDNAYLGHSHDGALLCPKCETQFDPGGPTWSSQWNAFSQGWRRIQQALP